MRKLLLPAFCLMTLIASGQKTICYEDKSVETPLARYQVSNSVSQDDIIKAKVKITNLTDKTLVIKPEECFFVTPKGNSFSHDRWMLIPPRDQEAKMIDAKGDGIKTENAKLMLNGVYICSEAEIVAFPDIKLPPQEMIQVGNFILKLDGYDQEGKEIAFKFNVEYVGNKVGMCRPGKATIRSASGKEFSNYKETERVVSMKKNDDFIVGFTFMVDSKKEDHLLLLNDMLTESVPVKAENVEVELKIDKVKTGEKNK